MIIRTITKYPLSFTEPTELLLPQDAEFIFLAREGDQFTIYVDGDPDRPHTEFVLEFFGVGANVGEFSHRLFSVTVLDYQHFLYLTKYPGSEEEEDEDDDD